MHTRHVVVLATAVLLWSTLPGAALVGGAPTAQETNDSCVGTMSEEPDEETLVSIQGSHFTDGEYHKRPALLVSYAPNGSVGWAWNASANGRWWAYDVDRQPNGNLLFATTEPGSSLVGELDPEAGEYAWLEHFDGDPDDASDPLVTDAHDADVYESDPDEIVLADKGEGHERLLAYDREAEEVTWEWRFEDHPEHYPEDGGGPADDWTHVNDVDRVNVSESDAVDAEGEWLMTSVRNFDQVAFVNRSSDEVELTLGEDGDHDVLERQHNPDHLWGPDDEHTVLVADSLNDRAVEYAYDHEEEEWDRVWEVTGLSEPRDADRLPNGNTLVTDRMGHRVVEVTPEGEVVWEVYTPYEPYDAERGDPGSEGPTMREHGVNGSYEAHGDEDFSEEDVATCADDLYGVASSESDSRTGSITGENRDEGMPSSEMLAAGVALVVVAVGGAVAYRRWG